MMYLGNRKQLHGVFEILFGILSIELDTYQCQVKIVINVNFGITVGEGLKRKARLS